MPYGSTDHAIEMSNALKDEREKVKNVEAELYRYKNALAKAQGALVAISMISESGQRTRMFCDTTLDEINSILNP